MKPAGIARPKSKGRPESMVFEATLSFMDAMHPMSCELFRASGCHCEVTASGP